MTRLNATFNRRALIKGASVALAMPYLARHAAGPAEGAAPMLGEARPTHYRFKLGRFEVTTIFDGSRTAEGPEKFFGSDQKPGDVQALAEARLLSPAKLEIMFSPVIVNTGGKLVVFDTGNGAGARPAAGRFAAALKSAGFEPEQVDIVVLTHFHPDHIGGLMENGKPLFPNAAYATHETEFSFWTHSDRMTGKTERVAKIAEANVKPLAEKTAMLKNGAEVASGITAMAAHGHTPGHTAFMVESEGKGLLIGGDFCNHFVLSLSRPEWHVAFDMDKEMAVETRKRVLDMLAADKTLFTSYHMPFPAVGFVERAEQGFHYVPATYQPFI